MIKRGWPTLVAVALLCVSCVSAPGPASATGDTAPNGPPPRNDSDAPPKRSAARERAQDLLTGERPPAPKKEGAAVEPVSAGPTAAAAASDEAPPTTLSAKEKQFFDGYLKHLKYMVVMKEDVELTEFQRRMVLTKGNEQLLRQGYDVVHYDQLQKNLEDQRTVYEAEAGESMSLTQFIAQKLGADVYVELDAVPRAWSDGGRHYGEANFVANMYDPSTAELLGSVTYKTDRSVDSSEEAALLNALTAGTAQYMPRVIRDSTAVLRDRNRNGIRYRIILQKTPDSRTIAAFRRNLRSRVREIVAGPGAADQMTMDVYLFDSIGVLEDACYSAFEKTPGLENAYWVYTRGKTITFNSGN